EVAQIITRQVRDTDLLGHTDKGTLAIVLLDADFEHSERVINRLVSRIENYEFPTALRIAVGAACYPTHAVDADSLKRQALSRPLVNWRGGVLDATGRTPIELRDTIAKGLKEYVTNPTVTVIVVEAIASQVFVMGEVTHPGAMQLHGPTTILQALAMAGGFKEFANTKDVKVLRPKSGNSVETLRFNYKDVLNGDAKPFYLRSGDTVVVP